MIRQWWQWWKDPATSGRFFRRCQDGARHRHATAILIGWTFLESIILPLPSDPFLALLVLTHRARAWFYAAVTTLSSALGGVGGYLIGYAAFEWIGRPILAWYGLTDDFDTFAADYRAHGIWIVAAGALTVLPYKLFTIASGVAGMNIGVFFIVSLMARGVRFFLVALLMRVFGASILPFIERRLIILSSLSFIIVVAIALVLRQWSA